MVEVLGFRVWGVGFRVESVAFMICGLKFGCLGCGVWGLD